MYEAAEPFSTIVNFPKAKPIFTYPKEMKPAGDLEITAQVKEPLVEELRAQTIARGIEPVLAHVERVRRKGGVFEIVMEKESATARRVIVALGRSGNFRKLGVPGEELDKVSNRLHDPKDFSGRRVLVVGGGDTAIETAIALALSGADVTMSYRKSEFARPKPENLERLRLLEANPNAPDVAVEEPSSERVTTSAGPYLEDAGARPARGRVRTVLSSQVVEIRSQDVVLRKGDGSLETIPNDNVFTMIGREPPLDFFRRSGVAIAGEWTAPSIAGLALFLMFCVFLYHWKSGGSLTAMFQSRELFPFMFGRAVDPSTLAGTITISMGSPGFWYTLVYSLCIVVFGFRRMRRTPTPYVRLQTWTLMAIQCLPLFLLPYIALPWAGHRGAFGDRHDVIALTRDEAARIQESVARFGETGISPADAPSVAALLPSPVREWNGAKVDLSWGNRILVHSEGEGGAEREAIVRLSDRRMHVRDDSRPESSIVDQLFPANEWDPHGREYWRAFGLVLAWPLFVWNVFTEQPMMLWLVIGAVQTLVIIPLMIWFWGKGSYCGWICSCGALAETLGDEHRTKMPHGPFWNRLNMTGQVILAIALVLLGIARGGMVSSRRPFRQQTLSWGARRKERDRSRASVSLELSQLQMGGGFVLGRHPGSRSLLSFLGARLVPLRLSSGGSHAHLRALLALRDCRRQEEVHLLQRVHVGVPSGNRHHELRQQGDADARSGMRALFGVRAELPDRRAHVRTGRQVRTRARAGRDPGEHGANARRGRRVSEPRPWPRVGAEEIVTVDFLRIRRYLARSPRTGSARRIAVIDTFEWVNVIALTPERDVILVRQWRHGAGKVTLEIPGGIIDPGEDPALAAARELREETGYVGGTPRFLGRVDPNPAILSNGCKTYLIEDCWKTGELELDPGEDIEVTTIPLEEIPRAIADGRISHALVVCAFWWLRMETL